MSQTPGQLLTTELASRGIGKSEFARMVKRTYATVNNWTKDEGFEKDQQELAARVIGLPSDHFDKPSLAAQRESYRRQVLQEFRETTLGASLSDDDWYSLESWRLPPSRSPTITMYEGLVHVMQGRLTQAQFTANLADNEQAAKEIALKAAQKKMTRKPTKRTRSAKKPPRKPPNYK